MASIVDLPFLNPKWASEITLLFSQNVSKRLFKTVLNSLERQLTKVIPL